MSTYSKDSSTGASSTIPSPISPVLAEVDENNIEANRTVPSSYSREPSIATTQHDYISAHFEDTIARVLQLPIADSDEHGGSNEIVIDSATEDELSLAITLALATQLQLLGSFVGMYAEFDGRLGDRVAGVRHIGMVGLLDGAISTIRGHVAYLTMLRKSKGQADAGRKSMEDVAAEIVRLYDGGRPHLKTVLRGEVSMYNAMARKAWVKRKDHVLGQLLGGIITELKEMEKNHTCSDEVRKVKGAWIESWDKYAAMSNEKLMAAGWMRRRVV